MIKAYNISFYRLLSTGYISEETYHAVKPKIKFHELSFSDCYQYVGNCRQELVKLFLDSQVMYSVGFMEKLETDIISNNNVPFEILDSCLSEYDASLKYLINTLIGRRAFLLDYVYCTKKALMSHNFVNKDNYSSILEFVKKYRVAYQNHFQDLYNTFDMSITDSELVENINTFFSSKPEKKEEMIESGEGFTLKETIYIDDDAFSSANEEDRKYVLLLYSLNKDKLKPIIDYFKSLLSNVSVRTLNGISALGFRNFLVNYLYADNTKLLNIRNLGKKSLNDFNKIKPKLLEYIQCLYVSYDTSIVDNVIKKENQIKINENKTLKEQLGENKYSIINKEFENLLERLSVRSRNGIINYKGDFIEDFVNKSGDIKSIQHIGKKSETEIFGVVERLKSLISTMKLREVSVEEIDIMNKSSFYGECFDEYALAFYRSHGHLPMFYMLARLLKKEISSKRDYQILNMHTPLFCDEDFLTLDEIANLLNLTRERVRQIHLKMSKYIRHDIEKKKEAKEINIEKIYSSDADWQYVRDSLKGRNYISINATTELGSEENHGFTEEYVFLIVSIVAKDIFTLIGRDPICFTSKCKQKWNNSYLVEKHLADVFDFNELFQIIENYEDTCTEDSVATAKDMLLDLFFPAWKEFDSNVVDELSEVLSTILIQEFGLIPDEFFRFTIEGKKEEDAANTLYDILSANGNPLSIDELYNAIDSKYPGKYKSPASIRIIVMKDPRMCSVGSKSLIGLIDWDHIKIGSIRDIIIQFLSNFDEPQHSSDIYNYVKRFRETSENSIRSTMISGEQFVQFSGSFYGLKGKEYPLIFYKDESERNFEQKIKELEAFLQKEKHFPFTPSNLAEESLYRWWNKNKNSTTLKDRQKSEIERIKSIYGMLPTGKRNSEWFMFCHSFSHFVTTNGRRPSRHSVSEKKLYTWFEKASQDFSAGDLTPQQEKAFLELCKSL